MIVQSMAKALGPDLRLAALAGDEETVSRVVGRQVLGSGWVSRLLQVVVQNLLLQPGMDSYLASVADSYSERRLALVDTLAEAGIQTHSRSGLNVWVPVQDEAHVVSGMQTAGYAVRAGSRYRLDSPPGVRITTACADVELLQQAASTLADLVAPRSPRRLT